MRFKLLFLASWSVTTALSLGCVGSEGSGSDPSEEEPGPNAEEELNPPPLADGFIRYETQAIVVQPGENIIWNEWVAEPFDADLDVLELSGRQSTGGHHALLEATTDLQPVGISREWSERDMLNGRTVGSIGGEGNDDKILPPGVVFRIRKGSALRIQEHFVNTSDKPREVRTFVDVKLAPADPNLIPASRFASTTFNLSINPNSLGTAEVSCLVKEDVPVLAFANHMHEWGVSVSTELVREDGAIEMLKDDPSWDVGWQSHPNYTKFPLEAPRILPAGGTVRTTCTWSNDTGRMLGFPDEMCVFTSLTLGAKDVACVNGEWN